jgi:hypothetical protein
MRRVNGEVDRWIVHDVLFKESLSLSVVYMVYYRMESRRPSKHPFLSIVLREGVISLCNYDLLLKVNFTILTGMVGIISVR